MSGAPPRRRVLRGLARSTHPLPAAAVTATATALGAAAGKPAGSCALLAAAVLAGQLTVGWSNDRFDVERDRRVGHPGKPLAAGMVPLPVADAALVGAAVAAVVLSLLLGWRAGLLHVGALAVAWAYNWRLKASSLSPLPYALAFGALPVVATLARPGPALPPAWLVLAAAALGTAVNFVNAMPAMAARPGSDVHGLPDRLGARPSLLVAAVLLLGTAALLVWAPPGMPRLGRVVGGALAAALVAVGVPLYWHRNDTRQPFLGLLVVAPVELLTVVVTGFAVHPVR